MKKEIIVRGFAGAAIGVTLGLFQSIISSLIVGNGQFYPCVPAFVEVVGSEVAAASLQYLLCAVLGAVIGIASMVWKSEKLSLLSRSAIFFGVLAATMLPIAYILYWMPHTWMGFLQYLSVFVTIFLFVWLINYFVWKIKIKRINDKLHKA